MIITSMTYGMPPTPRLLPNSQRRKTRLQKLKLGHAIFVLTEAVALHDNDLIPVTARDAVRGALTGPYIANYAVCTDINELGAFLLQFAEVDIAKLILLR